MQPYATHTHCWNAKCHKSVINNLIFKINLVSKLWLFGGDESISCIKNVYLFTKGSKSKMTAFVQKTGYDYISTDAIFDTV